MHRHVIYGMNMNLVNNVFERLLYEGGHAFDDVGPITSDDFKATWPDIHGDLKALGCKNVGFVGTTGKKPLMGDVDLVVEFPGTRDELFDVAKDAFGVGSAKKVGSNIVTIRYPVKGKTSYVQVDVMVGDPKYMAWSRFGTSPVKGHEDYSPVKGVVRNVLLNVINRFMAGRTFPGKQTELDRTRYSIDFDRGLFKVVQTKRNKVPGKAPTKDWKTVERTLVSDDPDVIAQAMFGRGVKARDIRKFEDVVVELRTSPVLKDVMHDVLLTFAQEVRELVKKNPGLLGDDPEGSIRHIERTVGQ